MDPELMKKKSNKKINLDNFYQKPDNGKKKRHRRKKDQRHLDQHNGL